MLSKNSLKRMMLSDKVAIKCQDGELSYKDLLNSTLNVAKEILKYTDGKQKNICILSERKKEFYIGILSSMISGCIYTIIEIKDDEKYALEKLEIYKHDVVIDLSKILKKHRVKFSSFIISNINHQESLIEDLDLLPNYQESCGYILYTSGSTGKPKAVHVTYSNIAHYTNSLSEELAIPEGLSYAHVSSLEADLGNTSIFLSLKTFGTLHILDHQVRTDPEKFSQYLASEKIDVLKITPSHIQVLLDGIENKEKNPLKYLFCGGEPLNSHLVKRIIEKKITERMFNHYGPTETTIGVLINEIPILHSGKKGYIFENTIPVGKPFGQTSILIETEKGYKTNDCTGELLIGGPSVSKGYINNDVQQKQKFISIENNVFYRSGDIVKVDRDGNVTFMQRKDRQVKIDGHRIELEELENRVNSASGINSVYFTVLKNGSRNILACAIEAKNIKKDSIEKIIKNKINARYTPKSILVLDSFPINANGKTDFKKIDSILSKKINIKNKDHLHLNLSKNDEKLLQIWRKYIFSETPSLDSNFYDLGGDSINAIQLISELQRLGFNISASDFMNDPSLGGIINSIKNNQKDVKKSEIKKEFKLDYPIIRWFFDNIREERNLWSQTYLFQAKNRLDPAILNSSMKIICNAHPILNTQVYKDSNNFFGKINENHSALFSATKYFFKSEKEIGNAIFYTSSVLQESINLEKGMVFRIHYFQFTEQYFLLFICHHLFIDAVSWKTIFAEFIDIYDSLSEANEAYLPQERTFFSRWSEEIEKNKDFYLGHSAIWNKPVPKDNKHLLSKMEREYSNKEEDSKTLWIKIPKADSRQLQKIELGNHKVNYDYSILCLALKSLSSIQPETCTEVFIESHGRDNESCTLDISRSVGWFTSMYPIPQHDLYRILDKKNDIYSTLVILNQSLKKIPNLGLPYGVTKKEQKHDEKALNICYNFLGKLDIFNGENIELINSGFETATCRGQKNNRVFDIKITVKLLNEETFISIEYAEQSTFDKKIDFFIKNFLRYKTELISSNNRSKNIQNLYNLERNQKQINIVKKMQSTGKLNYIPFELANNSQHSGISHNTKNNYGRALLTGATGYIGIHLLNQILNNTDMHVSCLIRANSDSEAKSRLEEQYRLYFFPHHQLDKNRVTCYAADITKPLFSLEREKYIKLLQSIHAVYHFAADTRLFNTMGTSFNSNVESTKNIIEFCQSGDEIHLHFASTLAISGVIKGTQTVVFSENSFDVGQSFQNSYEKTKYEAEKQIREYGDRGGNVKIYRYGNVSADSTHSRFQTNSADNRFIQMVKGIISGANDLTRLPEKIVLTPVDFVAKSTLLLSLVESSQRVFHIDYKFGIKFSDILDCLEDMGYQLGNGKPSHELEETDILLSNFWLSREDKKIRFNHNRTLKLLSDHGITETKVGSSWLRKLFTNLRNEKVLPTNVQKASKTHQKEDIIYE